MKKLSLSTEPKQDHLSLEIEALVYRSGAGLGRHEGQVIFVPSTAPGDLVEVEIVRQKKNFSEARLVRVLRPSGSRRQPPCPYFGKCGGCHWQHVDYAEQLKQKHSFVVSLFRHFEKPPLIRPIIWSPQEWRYRSRIQVHADAEKIGFKKARTDEVIDCETCLIATDEVNTQLNQLRSNRPKKGRYELRESGKGFQQVNRYLNPELIRMVTQELESSRPRLVWDLFGGNANLSSFYAGIHSQSRVVCVDTSDEAIESGRKQWGHLDNLKFVSQAVESFLPSQSNEPDFIIIDPPRQGLSDQVLSGLKKLKAPLLYISCDPTTFVRDIQKFEKSQSYRLNWIQPMDMFPQTAHLEIFSMLERF